MTPSRRYWCPTLTGGSPSTWHTFTEAWAKAHDIRDEDLARWAEEPRSKVTFDLEPDGSTVRLTVTHDGFAPGSEVVQAISQGWPEIISSLKTLLESGDPL